MVEGTPPGDALPPPPQRVTPARKGAPCGAGAGSPRPQRPHPGHTGHGTLAARSRGRAAGGGTAPDTRRPSQRWQAYPSGDGPPPPPRHAAPTGHAGQGDSVGPPHTHTRAHSTWVADPNSPPSGRAVGGGTAPDPRRPSQWWKAPPRGTPFRHPHSEQRRPTRAHAVGPVLGPHARTDRTQDTRVAEPWLPAPEDWRPGEGRRLTPGAPHNGGRPPPPGTAPHHPRGMKSPQGMQAAGTVLGSHTHTPAPTARGWRTPTARPVGGQSREGWRLASDAPNDGGRHAPRGRPSATPTASNAGSQGRTLWGRCWVPTPAPTAPRTHGSRNPGCPLQRTGGRGRDSACHQAPLTTVAGHPPPGRPPTTPAACSPNRACRPRGQCWAPTPTHPRPQHVGGRPQQPAQWAGSRQRDGAWPQTPPTMVEGTPPGDALPPPPQRATPARKGARCGAGAGSPRPHRPHPGHTGRGTLAARSRGRAAAGGTAPATRRPSQRWQATTPGDGPPPPPRHAAPTGHAGRGDSFGPPHPHTRANSTWVADPNSPPSGRAVGGGTARGLRRPPQWWKAPPPGTPFRHPHSEQRRPARAHAVGPVLGPHARIDRTRDTRVAEPWLPAPEDRRPGEGQRLPPGAPHNGGRPPPPGTAPHHPRGTQAPQGMQAKGTVLGPHTHTPAPTARGWRTPTARPMGGQSGEGQRLTSDAPHNGGRHPPRGRPSATPTASNAGPQGRTLWGRCWVPTPAPTAPRTHGSRNPGCPLQRTGGRGRDGA